MAAVALALIAEIWWLAHDERKDVRWNRGIRRFYAPPDSYLYHRSITDADSSDRWPGRLPFITLT